MPPPTVPLTQPITLVVDLGASPRLSEVNLRELEGEDGEEPSLQLVIGDAHQCLALVGRKVDLQRLITEADIILREIES